MTWAPSKLRNLRQAQARSQGLVDAGVTSRPRKSPHEARNGLPGHLNPHLHDDSTMNKTTNPSAKPKTEKATYRFTPGTVRRLKLLGLEWGTRSDGETIEVALRYLEQQTSKGLERLDFDPP
jgi:hypothetical protein